MTRSTRIAFIIVIAALVVGWLALRSSNAEREAAVAPSAPAQGEAP